MNDNATTYRKLAKLADDTLCLDGRCCDGLSYCRYPTYKCDVKEKVR